MKRTTLICVLLLSVTAWADDGFLANFGDVPLIEGMTELTAERVVFDTPAGTVAETTLTGSLHKDEVLGFYEKSLTALGWVKTATTANAMQHIYTRGEETLTLTMSFDNHLTLRLTPTKITRATPKS